MPKRKRANKPGGEIVVFVTAASEEEAARIGRSVVEAGLAACANVVPRIRSIFQWEGKVTDEQEALMLLKTRAGLFEELVAAVKGLHSYQVPEIIALPIGQGSADYLKWIRDVTSNRKNSRKN
jgi:periplasmic divalent cation tolerance protein